MERWEKFEVYSCNLLNKEFENYNVSFNRMGGTDSTSSDISVNDYNDKLLFNIEVKLSPAQSGQFVVLDNGEEYVLTDKSNLYNNHTQTIIDFLNENKEKYYNKSGSIDINCNKDVLKKWVKEHYQKKGCRFVVTSTKIDGYLAIIPIKDIDSKFEVSAVLRRKRSGTSHIPKGEVELVDSLLKEYIKTTKHNLIKSYTSGKKSIVQIDSKDILPVSERYFGEKYYMSPNNDGTYSLKKQSMTNNVNVVFSILYTGNDEDCGMDNLKNLITSIA